MTIDTTTIMENVVADIIETKPARASRVLPANPQPSETQVLQAMDELLGKAPEVKKAASWTIWVSCYAVGYTPPHGQNSINFLFQEQLADKMPRFDIVKLDAETWVFKPSPKGLRTMHVRGSRGRVTILDDSPTFRSVAVPLVEVDGVYMAHIPMASRLPVGNTEAQRKRLATLAMHREEREAEAKKRAATKNRVEAQQARRERERKLASPSAPPVLNPQQAQEKLVRPERLAQAMREFAAPIEQPAVPNRSPPQGFEPGPLIVGELKAALQLIRNIEAATPYRISRIRNEDGSTMLVWKAPNIV